MAVSLEACGDISFLIGNHCARAASLITWLQQTCEVQTGMLVAVLLLVGLYILNVIMCKRRDKVYVLDFAVHKPDPSWTLSRAAMSDLCKRSGMFTREDIEFQEKIAHRTDETAVCPAIQSGRAENLGIEAARYEFVATCFTTIEGLLNKTGVRPQQIKFVITNSSLFNPTPSLSAAVMNHFKMGLDTISYSLGGMGCSAGVIALNLARQMLKLYPESYALVVSHENITNNYYGGKDKSMLICNCLFRSNGSAVLLSNKASDARRSKYRIRNVVRTNLAADDVAYKCVMQTEDAEGVVGVRLNKALVKVGARALRLNMTKLGPLVLPWSELLTYAASSALRQSVKLYKPLSVAVPQQWLQPYAPDFTKAFDFFCIHTGGRGIIDGLEKEMQLSRQQVEPSRASLFRFGNTSSTSVWYELAYIESRQGLKRGQHVWQLAFGSGFKFNSSVLIANRRIQEQHRAWEGFDATAMWMELNRLEAAAAAARAAKAKLVGQQ